MTNILLCDDSGRQVVLMQQAIHEYQKEKPRACFQVFASISTKECLKYIEKEHIDIAIFDIEIDEKSGIDLAKELKSYNPDSKIIFVTNYDSFAYSAYQIEAFSYILKPLDKQKLFQQLDKILLIYQNEKIIKKYGLPKLEIKFKGVTTFINQEDVLYIEKKGKNVVAATDDETYEFTENLKELEKKLDGNIFLRCHNGFIVNMNRVTAYKRPELYVGKQEFRIPVSKANIQRVTSILENKIWESTL